MLSELLFSCLGCLIKTVADAEKTWWLGVRLCDRSRIALMLDNAGFNYSVSSVYVLSEKSLSLPKNLIINYN